MQFVPHHISISVEDTERSVRFYESFGFKVTHSYGESSRKLTHLRLGQLFLEIFEFPVTGPITDRESNRDVRPRGLRHFALGVSDIEAAAEQMRAEGYECQGPTIGTSGMKYVFVSDPDGIWFEIVEDGRASVDGETE